MTWQSGGRGLLHCVRNDGECVIARNGVMWQSEAVDCFTSFAMTGIFVKSKNVSGRLPQ